MNSQDNNFNRLTIIILTYNRYPFLKRLLRFYFQFAPGAKLIVLDSSSLILDDQGLMDLLQNAVHLKFSPQTFILDKIVKGLELVGTKYAVLAADDDFLIPRALKKCVAFLEREPSYVCAHGHHAGHKIIRSTFGEKRFFWGPLNIKGTSIDKDNSIDRLKYFFPDHYDSHPFYAVSRSDVLREAWVQAKSYISDWGLLEIFPTCFSIIRGKTRKLPIISYSREMTENVCFDEGRIDQQYSPQKLARCIQGLVQCFDESQRDQARMLLNQAFGRFFKSMTPQRTKAARRYKHLFALIRMNISCRGYKQDMALIEQSVMQADIPVSILNEGRKDCQALGK